MQKYLVCFCIKTCSDGWSSSDPKEQGLHGALLRRKVLCWPAYWVALTENQFYLRLRFPHSYPLSTSRGTVNEFLSSLCCLGALWLRCCTAQEILKHTVSFSFILEILRLWLHFCAHHLLLAEMSEPGGFKVQCIWTWSAAWCSSQGGKTCLHSRMSAMIEISIMIIIKIQTRYISHYTLNDPINIHLTWNIQFPKKNILISTIPHFVRFFSKISLLLPFMWQNCVLWYARITLS